MMQGICTVSVEGKTMSFLLFMLHIIPLLIPHSSAFQIVCVIIVTSSQLSNLMLGIVYCFICPLNEFAFQQEQETAVSVFYPREDMVDQGYTTFGYMKMQMVVAHGGRCAECIVFGDDITDGGRDDLEKITKVSYDP